MPENPVTIGPYRCGRGQRLLVIAGPCVIESEEQTLLIARRLRQLADALPISLVFKASFDKANRTSIDSYRGPGLARGLEVLREVKQRWISGRTLRPSTSSAQGADFALT